MLRALLLLATLVACSSEPPRDLLAEIGAPGPYAVGYRSMPVTYAEPITGAMRTTEVLAWYPAEKTTGDHPLYLLRVSDVAVTDAPALDLGVLPVVVFSHGHQAYASVMSYFMEHLASHGFLVLAPQHTGNGFADGDNRQTDIYYLRAHDVRAALDRMGSGGPALIMGHSFGGYTALALAGATYDVNTLGPACTSSTGPGGYCSTLTSAKEALFRAGLRDPRFTGVFALDPGDFNLFGASGVGAVQLPTLHMVAEKSDDPFWPAMRAPDRAHVILKGGDHNDFTDSCGAGVDLRCSTLEPARVRPIVNIYGLAFAQKVLLDDESVAPILDGTLVVSPLAEFKRP